jgi:hypothetical protein
MFRSCGPVLEETMSDVQPVTELIALANSGDKKALASVVERYLKEVLAGSYGACRGGRVKGKSGSDLALSVWGSVLEKFKEGGFAGIADGHEFLMVLRGIISFKAISAVRYERAKKRDWRKAQGGLAVELIHDHGLPPEEAVALADFKEELLKKLEPRERAIVEHIIAGEKKVNIPELLSSEFRKPTRHAIDRAWEKWKRIVDSAIAKLQ